DKYHIEQRVTSLLSTKGTALVGGVIGAGQIVISTLSSMVLVGVLSIYFLAAMPRTKVFLYRLVPQSRRPRVILIGDEIFTKVGGFAGPSPVQAQATAATARGRRRGPRRDHRSRHLGRCRDQLIGAAQFHHLGQPGLGGQPRQHHREPAVA